MTRVSTVRNGEIGWQLGDIIEIKIEGHPTFFVQGVPEPNPGDECDGCFGELYDENNVSICNLLPNRCGENKAVFIPACEVSSAMAVLSILENRRYPND